MKLHLGGAEQIDDPTPDDVRHYLRYVRAEAPFVILERNDEEFMQALYDTSAYRVEYRRGGRQYYAQMSYDEAVDAFLSFLSGDSDHETSVRWRRLTVLNTPNHPVVIAVICVLLLTLMAIALFP